MFKKTIIGILLSLVFINNLYAQTNPYISGSQKVQPNSYVDYTIEGISSFHTSSNVAWSIVGGEILSSTRYGCTVLWSNLNCEGSLSFSEDIYGYTGSLSVAVGNPVLSATDVEANYNTNPGFVYLRNVSTLDPVSNIIWEKSFDFSSWQLTGVNGSTAYNTGNVTTNYYIRAQILYTNGTTFYTDPCYIHVKSLYPGTLTLINQPEYNSIPQVSTIAANGGYCSQLQYQWEVSINGGNWNIIGNSEAFPSGSGFVVSDKSQVRRKIICGSEQVYSNTLRLIPQYLSVDYENREYVRENNVLVPGVFTWYQADLLPIGQKLQTTVYFDGLGRKIQQVSKQTAQVENGSWVDRVSVNAFDEVGRQDKSYLPFVSSFSAGKFKTAAFSEQQSYIQNKYADYGNPYSKIQFTNDPLNRVTKTMLPGYMWSNSQKGPSYSYDFNNGNEIIKKWQIGFNETDLPYTSGNYASSTLHKTVTTDEKGKMVIEYKDFSGNLVLSKVQDKEPGQGLVMDGYDGWVCTNYVYDNFGRLRFTITPKAIKHLLTTYTVNADWQVSSNIAEELCFSNFYDNRGRLIAKHTPGAGVQEFVYDLRNRPVFNRDANDKLKSRWLVTLYDGLDRVQTTGFLQNVMYNRSDLLVYAENMQGSSIIISTPGNTGPLETLVVTAREPNREEYKATKEITFLPGFVSEAGENFVAEITTALPVSQSQQLITLGSPLPPGSNMVTLTINFYDSYSYQGAKTFNSGSAFASTTNPHVLPTIATQRTLNYVTGQKVRVIDDEDYSNDNFLLTTTYYDERSNPLQNISENYLKGTDVLTNQYDYAGKVLSSCFKETVPGTVIQNFPVITKYEHDMLGRVTSLSKNYNNSTFKKLVEYKYDESGKTKTKKLSPDYKNGAGLETLKYEYNIQGWLTGINKDYTNNTQWSNYFGMELGYLSSTEFTDAQYNGNIAGTIWKSQGDNKPRKFNYNYTNTGYLKDAAFVQKESPAGTWNANKYDFSVPLLTYDDNGNITAMQQKGLLPGQTTSTLIDNLTYEYAGANQLSNRLTKVTDGAGTGTANGRLGDFSTLVSAQQFEYNLAGNLVKDNNKNIQNNGNDGIEYNVLNKPFKVIIAGKYIMNYVYDATGAKLARKVTNTSVSPNTTKWQYYINDMVLEDYEVQFFNNETGRLRVSKDVSFGFTPAPALTLGGNSLLINGKPAFFDFYITDHLDNTRMILTEEEHSELHKATMEIADTRQKDYEERMFGNVDANGNPSGSNELIATRKPLSEVPAWSSHYNDPNNKKASKLNQTKPVGPNAFLKVMAGDLLNLHTDYFYNETATSGGSVAGNIITSLVNALTGSPAATGGVKNFGSQIQTQLNNTPDFTSILQNPTGSSGSSTPNAHLNWLFFDENFNPVGNGATRVSVAGDGQSITVADIKVPANGYAFVYLSNSSNINVWFDEFWVTHNRGRILQENHYYPYGLQIASISSKAAGKMDNMYRYQGAYSEFEEETGWTDFELRTYDAQIGRWTGSDPYDQFNSPYLAMGNNTVNFTDPTGGFCEQCIDVILPPARRRAPAGEGLRSVLTVVDVLGPVMYNYINEWGQKFKSPTPQSQIGSVIFNNQLYKYTGTSQDVYKETVEGTDWVGITQGGLDGIGMTEIPIVSQLAELISAGISFGRGDASGGWIGLGSMIPVGGKVFEGMKVARRVDDVVDAAKGGATVAEQAAGISKSIGKNSISIRTPNKTFHFDLRGATHKGVPTPHIQRSLPNINSKTGQRFWNKDRQWVQPMTKQDIRVIKNYLKRQ